MERERCVVHVQVECPMPNADVQVKCPIQMLKSNANADVNANVNADVNTNVNTLRILFVF